MKRIHIEFAKTHGEPFPGFIVFYVLPTVTIAYYKSLKETREIYFELTWLAFIIRVIIEKR